MSKQKKAKTERSTHPLVHDRQVTRRQQRLGIIPAQPTTEEAVVPIEAAVGNANPETGVEDQATIEQEITEALAELVPEALADQTPGAAVESDATKPAEVADEALMDMPYCEVLPDAPADQAQAAPTAEQIEGGSEAPPEQAHATSAEPAPDVKQALVDAAPPEIAPEVPAPAKKKAKKVDGPKKLSALDAAAQVLKEAGQPMTCKEMIETMSKKGLWSSPNGATPDATLYAAILREMKTKGADARFQKTERGKFGAKAP